MPEFLYFLSFEVCYSFTCGNFFHIMQKRLAKEVRAQEIQAKNAAVGKKVKEPSTAKGMKGRGEASFYKVTCKVWFTIAESGSNLLMAPAPC